MYTLNGTLAVFLGPITGICLAALWSQYRNRLRLPDLYYQDGGAYYYQGGWNVLALVTMAVLFIFHFSCASLFPSSGGSTTAPTCWAVCSPS